MKEGGHFPFTDRQYLRLLCARSRWHELRDRVRFDLADAA